MTRRLIALAAFGFFAIGCQDTDPTTPVADGLDLKAQANVGPVVHHASMGGADLCEALGLPTGCDANFSLVAHEFSDGSVKGQWHDQFAGGSGIHVAVDCLNVVGNGAVIGGVITNATGVAAGTEGLRALTAVVDNGTSANDPADQLSFSFINPSQFGLPDDCNLLVPGNLPLFNLTHGQVKVF